MHTFSKIILLILVMQVYINYNIAQLPNNDSAWVKQSSLSDEFNTNYLDTVNLWTHAYEEGWPGDGASLNYTHNVIMTGTSLKLKLDTLSPNVKKKNNCQGDSLYYAYQGERIWTQTASYKNGWIEISAKYPMGYYVPWVAFWLWNSTADTCLYLPPKYYNEIDIAENGGYDTHEGNTGTNILVDIAATNACPTVFSVVNDGLSILDTPGDTSTFHKYAIQWDSTKINYFIDDSLVRTIFSSPSIPTPTHNMIAILEIKADPWQTILPSGWDTSIYGCYHNWGPGPGPTAFPNYLDVDYMRFYKLTADCNTALTLCSPSDYDRKVKKSITTNTGCTPTFNPSTWNSSYTLRATDYVILDEGTIIDPSGTGYFAIDIVPCPQ